MKLNQIFSNDIRISAIAGSKNSGKTNNMIHLLKDFRETDKKTPIYAYGFPISLKSTIKKLKIKPISSLTQLLNKASCILVLEEFQRLKLNDRRYKDTLAEFINFVYHRNVYVILSSPDIREFNSLIGGVIQRWLLKTINIDQCVNGSQIKKVIEDYKGSYKLLGSISVPKNELLVINDDEEIVITCPYEDDADHKKSNKPLFS